MGIITVPRVFCRKSDAIDCENYLEFYPVCPFALVTLPFLSVS
jgi:hypothetical protein